MTMDNHKMQKKRRPRAGMEPTQSEQSQGRRRDPKGADDEMTEKQKREKNVRIHRSAHTYRVGVTNTLW